MSLQILAKRVYITMFMCMLSLFAYAQKTVTGTAFDATGEPMIGVNVIVKGTTNGSITDIDGNFSLTGVKDKDVLVATYIGYVPVETAVSGQSKITFILKEDTEQLEEVVVVGYGVVKKRDLTGSVSSIKAGDIQQVAVSNAMQAMQARVPGLDIQQSNGEAGSSLSMTLRGNRSISASNSPLILVDGVEYGSTLDINPSDIESMEVLKDASSTAIYGTKGANGVIIITTKRGSAGKTQVHFNSYVSFNSATNVPKVMYGKKEVQRMVDKADYAANFATYKTTGEWGTTANTYEDVLGTLSLDDGTLMSDIVADGSYTDWADLILKNSTTQNYEVSVSGGNEKTTYSVSMGAMYDKGLMKNDQLDRYNGKISLDHNINKVVKVGATALYTYKSNDKRNSGVFSQAMKMTTITHPYLNDGSINSTPNPLYAAHCSPLLDDVDGAYQKNIETSRLFGNAYLQINPLKGMFLKSTFAIDRKDVRTGLYQDMESQGRYQSPHTSYISNENAHTTGFTWTNTVNYNTDFDKSKHDVSFLLGQEMHQSVYESASIYGDAGTEHYYQSSFYDTSKITDPTTSTAYTKQALMSYFGRVNYKFTEKYLLTASLRADGSSTLAEGHKWGYFPSVAAAWRLVDEDFLAKAKEDWLYNLKARVSWGLSGNAAVDAYSTYTSLSSLNTYYYMGNKDVSGKVPSVLGNNELTWETTSAWNFGLDFGIYDGRVSGSIDYYRTQTSDLLYVKSAPATSIYPSLLDNVGETEGHGLEISLNTLAIKTNDFSWDINWSYSTSKDKVKKLADGATSNITGVNGYIVGQPVSIFYDYETDGCWGIGEYESYKQAWQERHPGETIGYPSGYGEPGTLKIVDRNDDGKLSSSEDIDDRRVYKRNPKHIFGMNNTFTYKEWSLGVQVFARLGGYISYDMNSQMNYETANWGDLDYWTPNNTNAKFPSPGAASTTYSTYGSALKYEKADYVKIKDITLSYSLPKEWVKSAYMSNVKVYASMKNFFTFSSIDNYDSERGGSINFPLQKQVVVGLNVQF